MTSTTKTFPAFIDTILATMVNLGVPLLFSLALIFFLWGVFNFIRHAGNEADRDKYKAAIAWGIVGMAVMVSVWGLVSIFAGTIGGNLVLPQIRVI